MPLLALAILAPLLPYVISEFLPGFFASGPVSDINLAISLVISAVIAIVIAAVSYRININSAADLIRKAET